MRRIPYAQLFGLAASFMAVMSANRVNRAVAQEHPPSETTASPIPSGAAEHQAPRTIDAYEAMRRANRLLKDGKPADALELYELAEQQKPDAREIALAEGLAQYHLGNYEQARALFHKAVGGKNDALADDALYSLGTTYHSDALLSRDDPKAALANLEQAMHYYQSVLAHDPAHPAARDAYRKAGTVWRQLKQQMQQQQQQQPSDQQNSDEKKEQEQENEKQEDQPASQQEDRQQEQASNEEQQSDKEPQDQQEQQSSSEHDQDREQDAAKAAQQSSENQEAQAARDEQVTREQAERKLREMMQVLRERKERRRKSVHLVPVRPVDKDW